jgi:2-desacetyl-2-hydroxyethyl bacteriochlorophyllide A dehydrogenase
LKNTSIVFTEPYKAELIEGGVRSLKSNEVLIRSVRDTISSGTERANFVGDANVNSTKAAEIKFPRKNGYSIAGIIEAVGDGVTSVSVGDRVACSWTKHAKYNILTEDKVYKLDDSIGYDTGALVHIATFPLAAVRKCRVEVGESAIVMGLGVLGLISVKLLRAAGAVPIVAVDPNPERRELAKKCGADFVFDPFEENFAENVKAVTGGGVNVCIEVTGVGAGFNEALDCMKRFGRVALLGCTRNSDFTVDYYKKIHSPGITVIGAHTIARPECESHPGWFTHRDDIRSILKLCAAGRIELDSIVGETHTPEECAEVYDRLVNDRNFPIAVQFDWRNFETDK